MNCNCDRHFHKSTALTATATTVNITVTNATNISNLDCFELVLCQNPDTVVTGVPLPFTLTINGATAQLYNKYHLPIYSNRLCSRKRYKGAYVTDGTDAWVELFNTPCDPQYATSGVVTAPATGG